MPGWRRGAVSFPASKVCGGTPTSGTLLGPRAFHPGWTPSRVVRAHPGIVDSASRTGAYPRAAADRDGWEKTMTETIPEKSRRTGPVVAVMLLTAGTLLVVGRVVPVLGDALALVLGIELLVAAGVRREDGPTVAGGVLTGVGAAILLASGPLRGAESATVGAVFLLAVGFGFGLVALLSALWLPQTYHWAWMVAVGLSLLGAGLLAGADTLAQLLSWLLPVGLLVAGVALAVAWWHRRDR